MQTAAIAFLRTRVPSRLALIFVAAGLLGGCESTSVLAPAGRDMATYDKCLINNITYQPDAASSPPTTADGALARLAMEIGRGDALTTDMRGKIADNLAPGTEAYLYAQENTPFQQFLGCYVGDVNPIDFESRLVRGHIVLATVANYAAGVIGNSVAGKKSQYASAALGMIAAAELDLRAASWEEYSYAEGHQQATGGGASTSAYAGPPMPAAPAPFTYSDLPMRHTDNVHRIDEILSLAAFTDEVAVRNAWGIVLSASGEAITRASIPSIAEKLAGDALDALVSAIRANDYKAAEFASAQETLVSLQRNLPSFTGTENAADATNTSIKANFTAPPNHLHVAWATWDGYLSDACIKLSASSGKGASAVTCLPTDDQIIQASFWPKIDPQASAEPAAH